MFQRRNKGFIHDHGLIVTGGRCLGLIEESLVLHDGIVEFRVGIGEFPLTYEQFESFRQSLLVAMGLGEGTHDFGVFGDEGWMGDSIFEEFSHERIEESCGCEGWCTFQFVLLQNGRQFGIDFGIVEGGHGDAIGFQCFVQSIHHADSTKGRCEIDFHLGCTGFGRIFDGVIAGNVLDHGGYHLLGHVHEIVVIGIGLIEFAGGEFGIVREIDTLVTELPSDLVDTIESTHDEHLEVQFGCNA
mmetsp:Transcript_4036/g.5532  ORF Transcript_4036/g.5532 Transcript_4036/m.5532 type:complete len:243 (-) Transcript_4036:1051-1779(-)